MEEYFEKMCNILNLGKFISAININGGITNKLYKISTTTGEYAIKLLNKDNINNLKNIELSEEISSIAKENNINSIVAIKFNNKFIQNLDNCNFLVYNWCDGKVLKSKEISLKQVKETANQLAKLHCIKVNHKLKFSMFTKIDFKFYLDLIKQTKNTNWAKPFVINFDRLINIYDKVYFCYTNLPNCDTYTHKDLNRKNILWKENTPYIIDWETATIDNPGLDFFNAAWFMTEDVNIDKFYTFAKEYFSICKLWKSSIELSAFSGIIYECNWLEYTLRRALNLDNKSDYEVNLGKEGLESSLNEILNYYDKIPTMIKIITEIISS